MSLVFCKPNVEYAFRRKAKRLHFCNECHRHIITGDHYVEDHVSKLVTKRSGRGVVLWFTYKVCENCWRAPLNV